MYCLLRHLLLQSLGINASKGVFVLPTSKVANPEVKAQKAKCME
jgi:hypothetical protein